MTPKEMALILVQALDSKKGRDILLLDTEGLTVLSDYFVLCTGGSAPQLKALADAADYGDVVLHLFSPEAREFYDLDRLWQDAKPVDLSDVLK